VVGQWIWSRRDSALAASARRAFPRLETAVWVATVSARGDSLTTAIALPLSIAADDSAQAVIRIDDSVSRLWDRFDDAAIAELLDARVSRILALVDRGEEHHRTVQLDYDCPSRVLARYAAVLERLRARSLRGRHLWMTSLVAHVRDERFGALFRPLVDGHILQVFDTGDSFDDRSSQRLPAQLDGHRMPYMLGVASFERRLPRGLATAHRAWFAFLPRLAQSPWNRGVWVFPGGERWMHLLPTP
jgi:hypothetical protein